MPKLFSQLNRVPLFVLFKDAYQNYSDDYGWSLGAALAYYTAFSIAPILIISIAVAGLIFGVDNTRTEIMQTMSGLIGNDGAAFLASIIKGAAKNKGNGIAATIIGLISLLLGASGAFQQVQQGLNIIWKVPPASHQSFGVTLKKRFLTFAMVLIIAFLLLVSLVISAGLAATSKYLTNRFPGGTAIWEVVNLSISVGVVSVLFASMFKFLPDVKLRWKDVGTGAFVTALLFSVGKSLIGLYLGKSSFASAYGAAGSFVLLLVWLYYSAQIFFFGAEITKAYAEKHGGFSLSTPDGLEKNTPQSEQKSARAA